MHSSDNLPDLLEDASKMTPNQASPLVPETEDSNPMGYFHQGITEGPQPQQVGLQTQENGMFGMGYDPGLSGMGDMQFDPSQMDPMQQMAPLVPPQAANPAQLDPAAAAPAQGAAPTPVPGLVPGQGPPGLAAPGTPGMAAQQKGMAGFGSALAKAGAAPPAPSAAPNAAALGAQRQQGAGGGQMGSTAIAALMQLMSGQKGGAMGFGGQ